MRKVISWVLTLALVLTSFSMAFAANTAKQGKDLSDINGNANYDAIVADCDLGIVTGYEDGTYKPAQSVTRAEYAALITRMLNIPDSALSAYGSTTFSDMSGYGWANGYVGFCVSKGIIEGYEDGTFRPGNTITLNEAITMTLRAVGYVSTSSELVGSWPSNYVTLGKRLGLYDDVVANSTVDRASAAQIIYNTLTVYPVAVNKDGDTSYAYSKVLKDSDGKRYTGYETVLEVYLDCDLATLPNQDSDGFGVYTYSEAQDSIVNTMEYVGQRVKAFENSDGDVVAIAEVDSTLLTGKFKKNGTEFEVGDTTYTVNSGAVDSSTVFFTNMTKLTYSNAKEATVKGDTSKLEFFDQNDDGSIKNIKTDQTFTIAVDLSGKKIKEVYSLTDWVAQSSFLYEDDMIDDTEFNGYNLPENDDEDVDTDMFILNGVASLDKIDVDNVVDLYLANPDNEKSDIVKVNVGTKTVKGKVTRVKNGDYTIDGTVYNLADDHDGTPELSDEGTAYINFDGDVYKWDKESGSTDNYAIVLGVSPKENSDMDSSQIKVLTKEGKEIKYDVDDDATITGAAYAYDGAANPTKAQRVYNQLGKVKKGDLITFDTNKSGEVDEINQIATKAAIDNATTGSTVPGKISGKVSKSGSVFAGNSVDSDAIVFTVDGTDYDIAKVSDLDRDNAIIAYVVGNDDKKIAVFYVEDKYAKNTDYVYAVVNSVSYATNDDGDKVQEVEGFADGKAFDAYTDDDNTITSAEQKSMLTPLSLVVFDVDADGVIQDVKSIVPKDALDSEYFDDTAAIKGTVVKKDGDDVTVKRFDNNEQSVYTVDSNAAVYKWDADEEEYVIKSVSNLKKGNTIYLMQIDEDSDGYDVVLFADTTIASSDSSTTPPGYDD